MIPSGVYNLDHYIIKEFSRQGNGKDSVANWDAIFSVPINLLERI